ncbi:pentapeptide repeat-containing protein [Streptomyces chattanoogensis]|uniref:pentapeptide repeat-containing protein n=1 Tax=Streptomyces chattanoogensis TaxID=66876 RepID=UPI0006B51BEF|nr:pentapeptide repeat-containing protein [Streptomyces chattanoogensis]
MTQPNPDPYPTPPDWPHCGHGAQPETDPVGCRGRRVEPYAECLVHLKDADRSAYLADLRAGADIDHCGTRLSRELLDELLSAIKDPTTNRPRLGRADFSHAQFDGDAEFSGVEFGGAVSFWSAKFTDDAAFAETQFGGNAWFNEAKFGGKSFFTRAEFSGHAIFHKVKFGGDAHFGTTKFNGSAGFMNTQFSGYAFFNGSNFERGGSIGPLVCNGQLQLAYATFGAAVTIEAATPSVLCLQTRWASTAALRLRNAAVDLSDAVMEYPVSIAARPRPFTSSDADIPEADLGNARVQVVSLQGVDAAHLVLSDVDLTGCRFAGTVHLDQLRLEGRCPLPTTPSGLRWRGPWPVRWTPRRTLAEEQHWRAAEGTAPDGWTPAAEGVDVLEPAALAPMYRQLRKAFEDGKNEPGAADFYYGEMEMRRHDHDATRTERALLVLYWALSGYGLRASRALGWLLASMLATVLVLMLWGLPRDDPKPTSTGTVTRHSITMKTDTPDPVNPDGPYRERLSTDRFEKSLRVVINSVVFRSSGQDLTTVGTYSEMTARLAEPVLLGMAVLAIRGRVKRS